eukprot:scaffold40832_cov63-Phaeocystis_antarctica.AAC.5
MWLRHMLTQTLSTKPLRVSISKTRWFFSLAAAANSTEMRPTSTAFQSTLCSVSSSAPSTSRNHTVIRLIRSSRRNAGSGAHGTSTSSTEADLFSLTHMCARSIEATVATVVVASKVVIVSPRWFASLPAARARLRVNICRLEWVAHAAARTPSVCGRLRRRERKDHASASIRTPRQCKHVSRYRVFVWVSPSWPPISKNTPFVTPRAELRSASFISSRKADCVHANFFSVVFMLTARLQSHLDRGTGLLHQVSSAVDSAAAFGA